MSDNHHWPSVSLREITLPISTWNPSVEPRSQITYVDVSAVSREALEIINPSQFAGTQAPGRARKIIRTGDAIFATIRPSLKRIAKVSNQFDDQLASTAFCVLRPNSDVVDSDFLFFALQTNSINDRISALQSGASYPAVRDSDVLDQEIPLPELDEQRAVAQLLNRARSANRLESKALENSIALKQAIMKVVFTRGLRGEEQKESEIGQIPESWCLKPLTSVCDMKSGGTPPKSDISHWAGTHPWVSGKDLKVNRLLDSVDHISEEAARIFSKIAPAGSVLVLVRGMGLANGFALSLIERPMAFNQDLKALIPNELLDGPFLMHGLSYASQRMLQNVSNAAHGTKRLSQSDLDQFLIPLPSRDEQKEISEILDAVDRKIELQKRKKVTLQELFQTMLHRLMTGEVAVGDLNLSASETALISEVMA